jgi:hypothetical protein
MKAKYYIYWNLHKDCYSVRYRGKVILHSNSVVACNVQFKVSTLGRERVLRERKKNVHAFVVADRIFPNESPWAIVHEVKGLSLVKYNPYKYKTFVDENEIPVYNTGVVWLFQEDDKAALRIVK